MYPESEGALSGESTCLTAASKHPIHQSLLLGLGIWNSDSRVSTWLPFSVSFVQNMYKIPILEFPHVSHQAYKAEPKTLRMEDNKKSHAAQKFIVSCEIACIVILVGSELECRVNNNILDRCFYGCHLPHWGSCNWTPRNHSRANREATKGVPQTIYGTENFPC